jgi:hypothetical protein
MSAQEILRTLSFLQCVHAPGGRGATAPWCIIGAGAGSEPSSSDSPLSQGLSLRALRRGWGAWLSSFLR